MQGQRARRTVANTPAQTPGLCALWTAVLLVFTVIETQQFKYRKQRHLIFSY
uniref:Uncharacterized protein n=1 Tax=Mus musculus TaxID=10090 RepID=Q3TLE0_MOUSE|nr:unnamed protein product [Mus musculus]